MWTAHMEAWAFRTRVRYACYVTEPDRDLRAQHASKRAFDLRCTILVRAGSLCQWAWCLSHPMMVKEAVVRVD
ncbi:hypothetical protein FOMPIDRAFT_161051 [Fomitopsis schrenkii]|uniref:Uncharacterized protein n=1 Tax=Fomitopsis schrenkii TaxID=2126942 RepID=S8FCY7_FOMSC|nr:hypothetical protein FOMPIDRAFT_161051 [Fomitopsis schrenkii]